ncbi:hypothetical protein [Alkalicoccus chagannorensis]|uniref:hypothetical protein n=1 Tax=Alkalicoccus chagannorensis TaxID=427072 RepID=UPI0003F56D96|nr:hypothetical protein [Alkalicoccus chagannorensis]
MKTSVFAAFLTVGTVFSVTGLIFLFSGPAFGSSMANDWLQQRGSAETEKFLARVQHHTFSFLIAGGIFTVAGLASLLTASWKRFSGPG